MQKKTSKHNLRENPLISVVVVNWNGEKWLRRFLLSLKAQTYKNSEIIIVDNASIDNSINIIKTELPWAKVLINKDNKGFAQANNLGIKHARGKFILLLNNDTWLKENFIENIWKFYHNNEYDVISPREGYYNGKIRSTHYSSLIDPLGAQIYIDNYKKVPFYLTGVCLFFSKELYISTKGFDNKFFMYYEEVDWFWRLNLMKKKFSYIDDVVIYHAGAGSTQGRIKYDVFLWRNDNVLRMLIKNYTWYTLIVIIPVYLLSNLAELTFFLIIGKPKIAYTYIHGWKFNLIHLKDTFQERKYIQSIRKISDFEIIKKMYLGLAKLDQLVKFYFKK